jgi:phosphoglycolate phosphatase
VSAAPDPRAPPRASAPVQAVLFDLDGTLLDTVADIALALNRALAEQQLRPLAVSTVRELIGRGAPTLIRRARQLVAGREAIDEGRLLERFSYHHERMQALNEERARAYPGVAEGLEKIRALGLRVAVVTNKSRVAAAALLERLGLSQWIELIVDGDSCEQRKPHPQPLLLACQLLGVTPAQALMVGDSTIDVQAARAAGVRIVCVPYGYNEGNDPRTLACDAFIETLGELPALLSVR